MGNDFHMVKLQTRLAVYLHGVYLGASKRKRIAQDFNVSPDTVKGWLNGHSWPRFETFERMRAKFGPDFIQFVYGGMGDLDARITRLEQERRTEDARGALLAVEGPGASPGMVRRDRGMGGPKASSASAVVARAGQVIAGWDEEDRPPAFREWG